MREGEILALVGESGSGKTTLLRLAAGLEAPDSGRVLIGGETVAGDGIWVPPERRGVGLVFQDGALFPHLTVAENLEYGLGERPSDEKSAISRTLLEKVRLGSFLTRYPHELSGGERQRLAVMRALAPQPRVVLMDEPFSNLDPALRRNLRDEIRRILAEAGATAILVTHDTDDALAVGDRVAILSNGNLEQVDTPSAVFHRPANMYCARLFGPANHVVDATGFERWIRPEDMPIVPAGSADAVQVEVSQVADAGRHIEAIVVPIGRPETEWLLYCSEAPAAGDDVWVRLPQPL